MSLPQNNIFYRGDSIDLEFQLFRDKSTNTYWNLTSHQIRFQLNNGTTPIKKATANVSGGHVNQIEVTNAAQGIFIVKISKTESVLSPGDYSFEIEVTTPAPALQRFTVLQSEIRIISDNITWESKT